ncbi:AAA family ATPase [Paradevosia shaoguanensis]|uniref:AAA family ATPase n=1 Tax=Paradevosia shaoguanensis TaxID=1335043 RepID=UPI00193152C1|nr:AAA family ATPase [Paradevosia shaoguanensis]
MTVERFQLLRNVGQFDSVNAGAQIALTPLTLVYAENGRGKTTLAAILRSLSIGDAALIEDRHRLGAAHPPHVVLTVGGNQVIYQNGAWVAPLPRVAVFDDAFVSANVCSGIEIESSHRQNLHELILGARGVALNTELQRYVAAIEQHNRDLRTREAAIPAAQRAGLTVDAFCDLPADDVIDARVQDAERNLAAAQAADAIRQRDSFLPLSLPGFDLTAVAEVLAHTLPDVQAETAARVRVHLQRLGRGGEAWIGEGMSRISGASEGQDGDACPFCAQDLAGSPLIRHYEVYFSDAYNGLKSAIIDTGKGIADSHSGEIQAAFERAVRVAVQTRDFWRGFMDVPDINVDTAAILRNWTAARDAVLTTLRAKAAAPLEAMTLPAEATAAVEAFARDAEAIDAVSATLAVCNGQIALVKEQAAVANAATLTADLARLQAVKARHMPPLNAACDAYAAEKEAKAESERLRTAARAALDQYRTTIFPAYERSINDSLGRFNAGFRLGAVGSINTRAGSSASYSVVINNVAVGLTANGGPSFRTTLSAGDRNTLALAFFFASLEQDSNLADKIVVIDDPMTSLDEHRSLATILELRALVGRVRQVIVLSHSKPFLCQMWEGADRQTRSALRISRDGNGSTLAVWDVHQDCITEHDKRHALVSAYIQSANAANERAVAEALRPILEAYMRIAYPALFPPGSLLGSFINVCRQRFGQATEVLNAADIAELERLLNYANRFHHDSNRAWQTAAINDQELLDYAQRTLRFTARH